MSFLKLTFKPMAAIAMVKTTLPRYSITCTNSSENMNKELPIEMIKKPIKYHGSLT
jgi:hypothetical protein